MPRVVMGEEIQSREGHSRGTSVALCHFIFSAGCDSEEQESVLGNQVLLKALLQACCLMALDCAQPGCCWRSKPAKFREFRTQLSLLLGWNTHTRPAALTSYSCAVPWLCGSAPNALPPEALGTSSHTGYVHGGKKCISKKNAADRKCISFL